MKRIYSLIVILVLLLVVTGCNDNELVPSLSFDEKIITIEVGEEIPLKYSFENIKKPIFNFNLSVEDIVSIDSLGNIKGLSKGKTIITLNETNSNLSDTIEVNVLEKLKPEVSFNLQNLEIEIDEESILTFSYKNIENPVLNFVSSNEEIVFIDNNGKIKGISSGKVIITVSIENQDASDVLEITVKEPLITGPVYNITTNEELQYALLHIKDNESIVINGDVETDELVLNNIDLTINNSLTVNNLVSLTDVKILNSTGSLNYKKLINVSGSLEINSINLSENDILLAENSNIVISKNGIIGSVFLNENSNNIQIDNYGIINNIDLSNSNAENNKKIIINNYGSFKDSKNAIITNASTTPENTIIKSLGAYFWIEDAENYTNWDILENGPRYVLQNSENHALKIFLNNKSGSLEKVITDFINLYEITDLDTNISITTEYHSLSVDEFAFLANIKGLSFVDIYNTTISKNTIPVSAFENISTLKDIVLPKGITNISSKAFAGTSITNISVPESLVSVANDAFGDYGVGNYILEEVHLASLEPKGEKFIKGFSPKTLFFVPEVAVDDYVAEWVGFSAVVEYGFYYYGSYVFPEAYLVDEYYIRELEDGIEIVLYNGEIKLDLIPSEFSINNVIKQVVSIGNNAFRFVKNDDNLAIDITIPSSINRIGDNAFLEFKTIKSLNLNNVVHLGKGAFNLITYEFTIILSPNLEFIDDDAFNGLTRVTNIDLAKVVYLGERSLQSCKALTEVYMPSLKFLGTSSLSSCDNLEKATLGAVEECSSWTINGSNKLNEFDFTHNENKVIKPAFGAGWVSINKSNTTIYCNSEVLEYFQAYFPKANVLTK